MKIIWGENYECCALASIERGGFLGVWNLDNCFTFYTAVKIFDRETVFRSTISFITTLILIVN